MSWSEMVTDTATQTGTKTKSRRGAAAYRRGAMAEKMVALDYDRRDADLLETRWRGESGEIDLIFLDHGVYVFCEVKAADRFEDAVERLRPAQMQRICRAASEYLGLTPKGQLSDVRFDLAVVHGPGRVEVIENAFGHF